MSPVPWLFYEIKETGFPEPSIDELGLRVRFVFPLAGKIAVKDRAQSRVQSRAILAAFSDILLSASELAVVLGLETKTGAFKRSIKDLLERGLIEYTIPEKPQSRLQKYRLTEKGRRALEDRA